MPESAETSACPFPLVPCNLQSLYDSTALVIHEQSHFVFLVIHRKVNEFRRHRKQYNLGGENEEILVVLLEKEHIGLETPFCL